MYCTVPLNHHYYNNLRAWKLYDLMKHKQFDAEMATAIKQ